MSQVSHCAIVVTGSYSDPSDDIYDPQTGETVLGRCGHNQLTLAFEKAQGLGLPVSEMVRSPANNFVSFFVAPDGGKEGRDISVEYTEKRLLFLDYLQEQGHHFGVVKFDAGW